MLDLIIALLFALGVNTTESGVVVIDQQTGIVFGVGTTVGNGNSITGNDPTPVYILIQDDNGEYRLIRR